jgi:dienelactone hydrolase
LIPSNYVEFLTDEFFLYIEGKYRVKSGRSNRAITGFSTGGYSALSVGFQRPELFGSVSAHSPMLAPSSPFSAQAGQFFVQFDPRQAKLITHKFFINLLRRIFQNEENWDRQNPLQLARFQPLDEMPVYLDVADEDKRGYDVGAKKLVEILLERNVPVEFVLVRGLSSGSSHTYPGFLNGRLVSELAKGKTDKEADRYFHWDNVKALVNPDVQQVEYSLEFHSRQFQR